MYFLFLFHAILFDYTFIYNNVYNHIVIVVIVLLKIRLKKHNYRCCHSNTIYPYTFNITYKFPKFYFLSTPYDFVHKSL